VLLLAVACVLGAVSQKSAAADCTSPSTTYGTDTLTVSAPSSGTYYVWIRMQAPSTSSNEILMDVDSGASCFTAGGSSSMALNAWTWVDYQGGDTSNVMQTTLSQGSHSIELIGTEAGVSVDRIELLQAPPSSCTPTSTGENCAPSSVAPPTISFTSPSSASTVSGSSVAISADASSASGVSQVGIDHVVFEVDGTILSTLSSSPYTTTWNTTTVANGTHTLTAVATDTQGNTTPTTETVTVDNDTGCSTAPSTPGSVTATSSSPTSTTVTWNASTPALGCAITTYHVTPTGGTTVNPTTTSYTFTGLVPNTSYTYYVTASDTSGHTSATAIATVTTEADTTAPSVPSSVTATAVSANSVRLNWTASTDNVGVAYYRIYKNGTLYYTTAAGATSFLDTSDTGSTTYTYKVSAVDTSGNESAEAVTTPATITTPQATDTTPPSEPTNLTATLTTSSSIALSWNASTDNVGVGGYRVYRNGTEVGSVTSGTSYTNTGLSANTTYTFYVIAYDTSGNSSTASSTISDTTLTGTTATCSSDLNHDGVVNIFDASILFSHWGLTPATCAQGDINGDNVVNIFDASKLFSQWGQTL
jgi:chitodextrinase